MLEDLVLDARIREIFGQKSMIEVGSSRQMDQRDIEIVFLSDSLDICILL